MSLILDGTNGVSDIDGTAATPAIRGTDANTGIFFPAADTIAFSEGGTEAMRIDSAGVVSIKNTGSTADFVSETSTSLIVGNGSGTQAMTVYSGTASNGALYFADGNTGDATYRGGVQYLHGSDAMRFFTSAAERMRITSGGDVLVGATAVPSTANELTGIALYGSGNIEVARNSVLAFFNRKSTDGDLVIFRQDGTNEGSISVSGTTVSYNGGHLSRWSQLPDSSKDDSILKGTVMSNLDDMCVWEKDGVVADNEQLNKMKVSDVEGDTNVAGVFVNWTMDEQYGVDDMNVAMTGDMIIRIAEGVVVQKGDLLMSAGDGTAKPQGDDIVRSKTIAKVTSNYVTCTYADGSYCVPCVLMAC